MINNTTITTAYISPNDIVEAEIIESDPSEKDDNILSLLNEFFNC